MIPLQFTQWKNQNNDLVKEFASGNQSDCEVRFANLLVSLQSLPPQIMLKQLELSVAHSLLIISMLGDKGEEKENGLEKVTDSLVRLVVSLNPAAVGKRSNWEITDQVVWILENMCNPNILSKFKVSTLCWLSNTLSLLVLQLIQNANSKKLKYTIMDRFVELIKMCLEIYDEQTKVVKGLSSVKEGDIHNLVISDITKHITEDDVSEAIVVTRTVQVIRNTDFDERLLDEVGQFGDNLNFYPCLLKAVIYRKRRDEKGLYREISSLESNKAQNPLEVTVAALLLKAEALLDIEKSPQLALTFYSQVLRLDPGNMTALVGAALSFGDSGMVNSELDAWNIIVKTLHHGYRGKTKENTTFVDHLVSLLIPSFSLSLLDALTILARKCLALGKHCDAADKYLDVLGVKDTCLVAREETTHPWQPKLVSPHDTVVLHEAALALLLAGCYNLAIEVCQKCTSQWNRAHSSVGKRKVVVESHEMFEDDLVSHFLGAKASFELNQWDSALELLDKCFRSCVLKISSSENRQSKCIKLDQGVADEKSGKHQIMWNRLQVIRARLYFEKAIIFKTKGDKASFIACIKSSLVLHPCPQTSRQYLEALEDEGCWKEIDSVKNSINDMAEEAFDLDLNNVEDQGLKYLLDDYKKPIIYTLLKAN